MRGQDLPPIHTPAYGFALDACTGELRWASEAIVQGMSEGVIASGMWFVPTSAGHGVQVVRAGPQLEHLAHARFQPGWQPASGNGWFGGGAPAVVAGRVYVPTAITAYYRPGQYVGGVAVYSVDPGSGASRPSEEYLALEQGRYRGPYPAPIGYGADDPYLPLDPGGTSPVPPVAEWPTMNP